MERMEHSPVDCTMVKYAVSHTRIAPDTRECSGNSGRGLCVSGSSWSMHQSNMVIIVHMEVWL